MSSYLQQVQFNSPAVVTLRWPDFLAICSSKNIAMQYITNADTTYTIFGFDTNIVYTCLLVPTAISSTYPFAPDYSETQNNTDVTTFTTTYQALCNESVGSDISGSGTISALDGAVVADTQGRSAITFNISGTWVGNLMIQATTDGEEWFTAQGVVQPSSVLVEATALNNIISVTCGSFLQVQLVASSWTSGTANITWNAGIGVNTLWVYNATPSALNAQVQGPSNVGNPISTAGNPNVVAGSDGTDIRIVSTDSSGRVVNVGASASGAAVSGNPLLVAGSDGTDARTISTDTSGRLVNVGAAASGSALAGNPVLVGVASGSNAQTLSASSVAGVAALNVVNAENLRAAYSGAATFAMAASPTDIFTIAGSASKVIRVTRVEVSGIATTAVTESIQLIKRSAVDTGGTSATVTAVPHDASSSAATATVLNYTANPTVGAAVGAVRATKMSFPLTGTFQQPIVWEFGDHNGEAATLRAAAQQLAIAMSGTTVTGNGVSISIEWTEDSA